MGAVFAKAFRMLGLDERKVRWVVDDKIFMGIFRSTLHGFFPLFLGSSLTECCSIWYGVKDLFSPLKLADKAVLDF